MHLVARRAAEFGAHVDGSVRFELGDAVARKDRIVGGIVSGIYRGLDQQSGITLLRGHARFLDDHTLDVGDEKLTFSRAIIAVGARNAVPPIDGIDDVDLLDNRTALLLEDVPESLIVIGGGYVGIEFAQMYARFGSKVTLLGRNPQLAPGEDSELAALLAGYLREEGIDVRLDTTATRLSQDGPQRVVTTRTGGKAESLRASHVLVATGRVANVDELALDAAGVRTTERGFVEVDEGLATSQPHISAIGDVKGGWMFTHVATYDGPIAALNQVKGAGRATDYRVTPRCIFADPVLAAVGLTADQAEQQGYDVAVGTVDAGNGRSRAIGDTRGRLKAVVNAADGEILGFHVLAHQGDELLHEAVAAMHGNGRVDRIARSIHAHPTLSELVKAAAKAAR
ncbi:MAG: FAD-dependent oxidoreductase [Myxococcales bacterium]|nr:FAD-dependent oxidoreductase [Myxococcales bacterium]